MKQILATTAVLALSAGFASAEITFSGSAIMGVANDGTDTRSILETYLTASAAAETGTGLSFGFDTTIAIYDTDGGLNDDGTSAYISGAWGKLSMGSVSEADEIGGGLPDVGLTGLGVDNVAETYTGDNNGGGSHDVNYTYSGGAITAAISAEIGTAGEGDSSAVGLKYSFDNAYVAVGYYTDDTSGDSMNLQAGGTFGAVGVKAMWTEYNPVVGATENAMGASISYTADALTLTAVYGSSDADAFDAYGLTGSYDLGGGASVVGGVASVADETVYDLGISMSF